MTKIYLRDRIYVPLSSLEDRDEAKRLYTKQMFRESGCAPCEYKEERPCATCESCPNYQGAVKLWVSKHIEGKHYLGFPIGDKKRIENKLGFLFTDHTIVDIRKTSPLKYKIKWLIDLYPHQTSLVDAFMKKQYGLIEAPPRTGKTAILLYLGLQLGQRMVLLAHQHEYLQQFLWHIEGNEEEGIPKCTNLPEIQEKTGKKLYGFPKTAEDFETMQFMVMTYQSLADTIKGKIRLKALTNNVGTVSIDECFTGEHSVLTELGLLKLIDIVSGVVKPTQVLSRNTTTSVDEFKSIESVTRKKTTKLCRVRIAGLDYVCTPTHLFWSITRKSYVEAQHLKPNEEICFTNAAFV